jgi:hypothetical protein
MPVTNISSNWVSGNLVFYETGVGQSVTGDILTIGTSSVIVGNTGQDVDFKVFMGASDTYVLFDVGNKKVTFAKVDVEIDGDLTLDLEDLQLGDDQYLQFGDATGGDVYMSWISATSILTILPTTDDTGAIHIGNGTKDIDFKVFLGAADTSALFDVGNTSLTLAKVNLTFSTALDIITAANTAVALEFYDATTKYVAIDTRNTVAADMLTVTGIPATIAGASGTTRRMLNIVPGTTTLTGSTGVTNMSGIDAYFTAPTLTDSSAITVAKASTVCIAGVPTAGGSVTITSALALEVLGATNFGVDAAGVDVTLFGAVTGYKVWFDANGDTNGAVFFGADTKGIQVNLYGDVTGCGVFWDPTTDTNGTLTIGGSGGSKGNDVVIYGATNAAYLKWDQSADKLLGYGNAQLQIGESTTGVVTAGGTSMIYGYGYHITNALTGTLIGVRGNAVCHVASVDGTAQGVFGRAANGKATTDTDGVNLDTAIGVAALVAGVGLAAAGPAILEKAYGLYSQLDIDAANLTVSDARGLYINVQSGNASANTLSLCNLAYLEYESVVGTAPAINSAIRIAMVGGCTPASCLIDATGFQTVTHDTDQVTLFKFLNASGVVITCSYDTDTPGFVFA